MLCAIGFTILGLLAAIAVTFTSTKQDNSATVYAMFMFGGLAGGLLVGCLATIIGAKMNQK